MFHQPAFVQPAVLPGRPIPPGQDGIAHEMPMEQIFILRPGQADFRRTSFITRPWIGMIDHPVFPESFFQRPGAEEIVFHQQPGARHTHLVPVPVAAAGQDHTQFFPAYQIVGNRQAGLVPCSVKANEKQIIPSVMAKRGGTVHGVPVKTAFRARAGQNGLSIFVRGQKMLDIHSMSSISSMGEVI